MLFKKRVSDLQEASFSIDASKLKGEGRPFVPHFELLEKETSEISFENYVILDLPPEPVQKLRKQIEERTQLDLSAIVEERGVEAHITLLSPLEIWNMRDKVSIHEINKFLADKLQDCKFKLKGIGRGELIEEKIIKQTFFIICESSDLFLLRESLANNFNLSQDQFDPHHYYPHITLGYTHRDLHEADGIIKNDKSFWATISFEGSSR